MALYFLLFLFFAWRNLVLAMALLAAFLPSYLIRFQLSGLPMTLLEGMILTVFFVWLIKKLAAKRWLPAAGLFLAASALSVFVSPNLRSALGVWKAYFLEPILLFVVFISIVKTRADLNKIVWGLVLGALPIAVFAIIQKFTGWLIPNPFWQAEETRRVTSFFGFPNAVALYLAPIVPLVVYFLSKKIKGLAAKDKKQILFSIFLFIVLCSLFLAILFARSAGAIAALAATTALFGLLNNKIRWLAAGLIVLAFATALLTPLKKPLAEEFFFRGPSGVVRLDMWAETVEMLKSRPVFGAGLAGYQTAVAPYHVLKWAEIYLYPHNLFLNFWSETGIIGLVAFLIIIYNLLKTNLKIWREKTKISDFHRGLSAALFASFLIIVIHGLVDVPYFKNDLAAMFWILAGATLVNAKLAPKTNNLIK